MQFHEVGIKSIDLNEKSLNLDNIEFEMDAVSVSDVIRGREFTQESGLNKNSNINELSDDMLNLSKTGKHDAEIIDCDDKPTNNADQSDETDAIIKSDQDVPITVFLDKQLVNDNGSGQCRTLSLLETTNNKENKFELMNGLVGAKELNLNSELNLELPESSFDENNRHTHNDDLDKKSSLRSEIAIVSKDSKVDNFNDAINKTIVIAVNDEQHNLQMNTICKESVLPKIECGVKVLNEDINIESNIQCNETSIESEERLLLVHSSDDTPTLIGDNSKIISTNDVDKNTSQFYNSEKTIDVNVTEISQKVSDSPTVLDDKLRVESSNENSKQKTKTENNEHGCNTDQNNEKNKTFTAYLETDESESYNGVDDNIKVSSKDVYKIIGVSDTGAVVERVSKAINSSVGDEIRQKGPEIGTDTLSLSESIKTIKENSKQETKTENNEKGCNADQNKQKNKKNTAYLETDESDSYKSVDNNIKVSPEDVYKIIGVNDTVAVVENVSKAINSSVVDEIRQKGPEIGTDTLYLSESIKTINDSDNKMDIDLKKSDTEEQTKETIKSDVQKHNDVKICTDIEMTIAPNENIIEDCLVSLNEKPNDSLCENDLKTDLSNDDINVAKIENETSANSLVHDEIFLEVVHGETNEIYINKPNSVGSISKLVTSDEMSTSENKVGSYAKMEDDYVDKTVECMNNDSNKCSMPTYQSKISVADEVVDLDFNSSDSSTASKIILVPTQDGIKVLGCCKSKTTEVREISPNTVSLPDSIKSIEKSMSTNTDSCSTLNIISDDEDESIEKQCSNEVLDKNSKPCVTIDDDDDVMVIDEFEKDNISKKSVDDNVEAKESVITEPVVEKENPISNVDDIRISNQIPTSVDMEKVRTENDSSIPNQDVDNEVKVDESHSKLKSTFADDKSSTVNEITKSETDKKVLFSSNFIKTFKKSLGKMTRDDLEEFCLVKIVEAIAERSNLSELKTQVKVISENVDEWRKKYMLLSKQNRDLEIVLRTVTDEHKKRTTELITPLKVTRSVGLQVHSVFNQNKNVADNSMARNRIAKQSKTPIKAQVPNNRNLYKGNINKPNPIASLPQKPPIHNIPVPRLVPLPSNPTPPKPLTTGSPTINSSLSGLLGKALSGPNGVKKTPPIKQPEKRTFSQSHSQAIDLTDDEPPSKLLNMNSKSPIRGTAPQSNSNFTRPTATSMLVNGGTLSQRQVYIPISTQQSQGNVRPGQTIMFKAHGGMPANPRYRQMTPVRQNLSSGQSPVANIRGSIRIPTMTSHPAPLPQAAKQPYHNSWKLLPPSPELKISKVDNGIVISWIMEGYVEARYEEIASYQIYAYQETTSPPSTTLWKKIGDVKALPLPMACTLTQFMAGYKYYFAVRAVDVKSRVGPFSLPGSILLLNKK